MTPPPSPSPSTPTPTPAPAPDQPSKAYQPAVVEPRIIAKWNASGAFRADPARVRSAANPGGKQPFCILIPPPNVTGALHLGHALNNTLQDVLTRAHRMMGFETLWIVGTDHAGIATQAVVERRLKKEQGKSRKDFTREQFIEQVQTWKDEYEQRITGQLKHMGCSCDFSRQRFTMDDICARAVREAFFRLFKDGLIYRGKRLVNWDPVLQTAVADDECYEEEVDSSFYYLRYPLVHLGGPPLRGGPASTTDVQARAAAERQTTQNQQPVTWNELALRGYPGADQHPGEQPAWITVATTRPETYLGDTAVAVSPKDHRAKALRGLFVELPLVGRIIPIVEDDYVVLPAAQWADQDAAKSDPKAQYATGFLKVTPAHDQNDYELALRHTPPLPMVNIFAPDATISDKHGWSNAKEIVGAHVFLHKSREDARTLVIREFEARGLLEKPRPYRHSVKFSDRSKAVIEPYLSDQWYVRVTDDRLSGAANRALVPEQRTSGNAETARHTSMPAAMTTAHAPPTSLGAAPTVAGAPPASAGAPPTNAGAPSASAGAAPTNAGAPHANAGAPHANAGAPPANAGAPPANAGAPPATGYAPLNSASTAQPSHNPGRAEPGTGDGSMRFYPARYARTYEQWLDPHTIRDWCISRQLWWGHRIPVWSSRQEAPDDLKERLWKFKDRVAISRDETFTHVCFKDDQDFALIAEIERPEFGYTRDPDVLDTWFSSALWPLSTMGWPDPDQSPETAGLLAGGFNPTSVLSTAREIITLWVSRMVMMNRYLLSGSLGGSLGGPPLRGGSGETSDSTDAPSDHEFGRTAAERRATPSSGPVPFHDVFIHAVVQDGEGRKMSKSAGNGVDPLDIIESHGADAMRFTLAQMTTQTQDVRMPVKMDAKTGKNTSDKFDAGRNFVNKLWNASRFAMAILDRNKDTDSASSSTPSLPDRWLLSRLAKAVRSCEHSLKNYEFADYCQTLYQLLWWDYCDWYLEAIKPTVDSSPGTRAVLRTALDVIIRLLHPVAPFITETIHEQLSSVGGPPLRGGPDSTTDIQGRTAAERRATQWAIPGITLATADLLCTSAWPSIDASLIDEDAEKRFEELRELITAIRNVRSEHQVLPKRRITLHCSEAAMNRITSAAPGLVVNLSGLDAITASKPAAGVPSVAFRAAGEEMHLTNMADAGTADTGAEKNRLTKQRDTLIKSEAALNGRLSNPGYVDKAPPKLVEESKLQLEKIRTEIAAIEAKLKTL